MNKLLFAIALAFFISIGLSPGHSDQKEQQTGAISAEVKKEAQETGGTKTSSVSRIKLFPPCQDHHNSPLCRVEGLTF